MLIKIIIIILSGILNRLGGWRIKQFRRIGIPLLLGGYFIFRGNLWSGFVVAILYGITLSLGVGNWSPLDDKKPSFFALLTKDESGILIRTIWCFLVSSIGALPIVITKQAWVCYPFYVALNTFMGYIVTKFKLMDFLAEWLVGVCVATVIFL